jgi:hypothetical protein
MSFHARDVVLLTMDLPAQGLKRGDLGAVVDVYLPDAIEVEFVTASGRTQALLTLRTPDIREVGDDDLVTVRPAETSPVAVTPDTCTRRTDAAHLSRHAWQVVARSARDERHVCWIRRVLSGSRPLLG